MSWLLSFKGLSLSIGGKGRKNKRNNNNREQQDSQGRSRKRLRPSSSCYNSGSYDLAAAVVEEERPNRFSWAASPFAEEEYMNNDVGKTDMCSVMYSIEIA